MIANWKGLGGILLETVVPFITFAKVLKGEKINRGTGKTLASTEKDHVFVYFADHGAKVIVSHGLRPKYVYPPGCLTDVLQKVDIRRIKCNKSADVFLSASDKVQNINGVAQPLYRCDGDWVVNRIGSNLSGQTGPGSINF